MSGMWMIQDHEFFFRIEATNKRLWRTVRSNLLSNVIYSASKCYG